MSRSQPGGQHNDAAGEQSVRDSTTSRGELVWLIVLIVGLALVAGLG